MHDRCVDERMYNANDCQHRITAAKGVWPQVHPSDAPTLVSLISLTSEMKEDRQAPQLARRHPRWSTEGKYVTDRGARIRRALEKTMKREERERQHASIYSS
uniref:Uncharacterized protein n=1 Tax=Heterorhabditis bacteriophora TaxID=37862 RepID=A0A1I7WMS3_HETBA